MQNNDGLILIKLDKQNLQAIMDWVEGNNNASLRKKYYNNKK